MAEVDGIGRYVGTPLNRFAYSPPLSPSSAAAGVASAYLFPAGYDGSDALRWGTHSAATAQGGEFTVPAIPGRQYTASIYVWQTTTTTQEITIDGTTVGSTLAIPLAWTRLTVTFTATQPTHLLTVQTTGQVVPGAVSVDAVQLEPGASASTFTTSGPVIYGIWRGYVERWPASWAAAGKRGYAEIACVDAFGPQNKINLWTEVRNSILAKAPDYYWPLSEPSGTSAFAEASGNSGPPLSQVNTPGGPATVTAGASTVIAGDPSGVGVQFAGQQGVTLAGIGSNLDNDAATTNRYLAVPIGSNTATWAASLAMVFTCPDGTLASAAAGLVLFGVYGTMSDVFPVIAFASDILNTGKMGTQVADSNLSGPDAVLSTATYQNDTKFHQFVLTVNQAGGNQTVTLYADGSQVGTTTVNVVATYGTATPDLRCSNVEIGGETVQAGFGGPDGTYAHCAAWNRALSAAEVADMWSAFGGYVGETSGARVARQLSYGWTGLTSIQAGLSVMGVSNLTAGTKLLASVQAVTTTENGDYWVNSLGQSTFDSRLARYLETSSTYTFGENYPVEYPYQDGIGFDLDPTLTYDSVSVENYKGITAIASNATTTKKYFPNSYPVQINVEDNNEAIDHATYILQQHDTPRQRVASIVLNPVGNPQLWPVVLSLEVGMRVTVVRRATAANNNAGLVMSADYFVESVSHDNIDMEAGTWQTTLLLSPVDLYQVGILNDATFGRLGSATAALVSSISSSATTATVSTTGTTTAASAFTTAVDANDCPFNATIDGTETVQVSTVAGLLSDTFGRTTSNGWGTASSGQTWTTSGGSAGNYSTNGSVGQIANASVNVGRYVTTALAVADIENTIQVTVPAVATGAAMNAYWLARFVDTSNHFRFQLTFNTDSTIDLKITKVVAGVATVKATYSNVASYTTNTVVNLRAKVLGTGLYANAWLSTATEPPGWMLSATEATDLTAAGGVGVLNLLTTGNTNASPAFSFDNITTITPQTFTIVRPTDGSATSHSAGASVQVVNPFILAF